MISTIAWHEFWFTVKRKSYYLVTFGMPLILLAYFGLIALIVLATVPSQIDKMNKPVGIIDQAQLLTRQGGPLHEVAIGETSEIKSGTAIDLSQFDELNIPAGSLDSISSHTVLLMGDLEQAKTALQNEKVRQVTVIPADYVTEGRFQIYVDKTDLVGSTLDSSWLSKAIARELLAKTDLSNDTKLRIQKTSRTTEFEIGDDGQFVEVNKLSKGFSLGIPLAVAGLLIIALMMNSSLLIASIAEEKENKVMEVILSSVSADKLLFGKVIGIVMAGVLQIVVWMAMVSIVPVLSMAVLQEVFEYEVHYGQLMLGIVFVLLGFVFYGSLLTGMGSLGSNYKDCQQLSVAVILCACVPFMMPTVFVTSPDGWVARIMSWIPLFSPVAMMARLGVTDVPWWEIIMSMLLLLISIYFAVKLSAKLFRAGTLMQGKRPGIREIWKVMTQAA